MKGNTWKERTDLQVYLKYNNLQEDKKSNYMGQGHKDRHKSIDRFSDGKPLNFITPILGMNLMGLGC